MQKRYYKLIVFICTLLLYAGSVEILSAKSLKTIRVATLKFGTFNWELSTLKRLKLDTKYGFNLKIQGYAGKSGSLIAFKGNEADVMVTDWLWVSNQRAKGMNYLAVPYSKTVGGLVQSKSGSMKSLSDLDGKKIGIVGGPLDKNWLLLQAVYSKETGRNIKDSAEVLFGAPSIISKKLEQGDLDSAFLFWHYVAKLNAKGYPTLVDSEQLIRQLGVSRRLPMLVYTFQEKLAEDNPTLMTNFIKALYETKKVLLNSDEQWKPLRKKMKAKDDKTYQTLIARWREGVPRSWQEDDLQAARKLFLIFKELGGKKLVKGDVLDTGIFWDKFRQ
ncbi:MAG: ABC transporter substrate-binding protein [Proteobacteria bacterium]|nr:ABC transporter substrate-binding protein [Pseudomonadota bacterium]